MTDIRKVIIIGSGPAGYTAGLYAGRANLSPLLFQGEEPGGQLTTTTLVENYPGFVDGVQGPELMNIMREQAEKFGCQVETKVITKVDFSERPFRVWSDEEEYHGITVIIATGASAKLIGLESEKKLMGHGVSTCAVCDGFFFRGKEVAVVGGGDTAMEDSTYLTKFANKVNVIHRRDSLRASKIMQERAFRNEKIQFIWNSVIDEIRDPAAGKVTGVRLKNVKTGEVREMQLEGVFVAIGHEPNTKIFRGQVDMDDHGYIKIHNGSKTSVPGVFAAGDVHDPTYRQAVNAAGAGCIAALDAEHFLAAHAE
ncbi:MAG: thioredoxin-disulfide reductase [bacterium]